VYLIPGLFGFGKLAGYDYFEHIERALSTRFEARGIPLEMVVVASPPTASISQRAAILEGHLAASEDEPDAIHLVGHSTGGLDARLVVAPGARIPGANARSMALKRRIRSVVTLNTPHYGTPLASYFATAAGTRMLYLLSVLTVASLSIGRLPLGAFSAALSAVSGIDRKLGLRIKLLDDLTTQILSVVSAAGRAQIVDYLAHVKHDQGGIIQLMPEVMELFNATVGDHPDVRYGSIASVAPLPGPRRVLSAVGRPISALHLAVYSSVYGFASRAAARYPYATLDDAQRARLGAALAAELRPSSVDGIVPTLSMVWGELIACVRADHLDIVGHFGDHGHEPRQHVDWLQSGAGFTRAAFAGVADALAEFLLR
jgi:triacylglycerol lipase